MHDPTAGNSYSQPMQSYIHSMARILYRIIYKNKASRESTLDDLDRGDFYASSVKQQIAKENGIDSDNFKMYAINPHNSTKILLESYQTITEDTRIVELYEQELLSEGVSQRGGNKRKGSSNSLGFQETSQLLLEKGDDYNEQQPQMPPHVHGVFRMSRWVKCFSKQRFFQLNPDILVMNIYKNRSNYPKRPIQTVPLLIITKISRLTEPPCFSSQSYMRILTSEDSILISFESKSTCNKWLRFLKKAILYAKYVETKRINLKDKWRPKLQQNKVELVDELGTYSDDPNARKSSQSNNSLTQTDFSEQRMSVLFEHFEFQKKIGNGSFGLVYLGFHKKSQTTLAIKQLNKDQLIHRQQLRYAITQLNILKEVKHPFIVSLHFAFQTKQHLYLAMNYCPNGNLKDLIVDNQKLTVEDAVLYTCEIILAIEYLHKKKIIYRDLKPDNILLTNDYHVCLSDFGLSKTDVDKDDFTQSFLGTPAYLAPEMVTSGRATFATDIYGIGAILYQMLHGHLLYAGSHVGQILHDIKELEPEIDQRLPKEVKSFLRCSLEKDPQKRIKSPKQHPLFTSINWKGIQKKKVQPGVRMHQERSSLVWDIRGQQIDQDYNQADYLEHRIQNWVYQRPA